MAETTTVFERDAITLYEHGAGRSASTEQHDDWKVGREYVPRERLDAALAEVARLSPPPPAGEGRTPREIGDAELNEALAEAGIAADSRNRAIQRDVLAALRRRELLPSAPGEESAGARELDCEGGGSYSEPAPCTTGGADCACNGPLVLVDPCPDCGGTGVAPPAPDGGQTADGRAAVLDEARGAVNAAVYQLLADERLESRAVAAAQLAADEALVKLGAPSSPTAQLPEERSAAPVETRAEEGR